MPMPIPINMFCRLSNNFLIILFHFARSLRQRRARLFGRHVFSVPFGPVRVALPGAFLVLSMRGLCTPKCTCQVAGGAEGSLAGVDTPGKSRRDLLEQPTVAV